MVLEKIVKMTREEVEKEETPSRLQEMKEKIPHLLVPRDLITALFKHRPMALIAEIKRASPSLGMIKEDVDLGKIACAYKEGGACAISVLTEAHFFKGNLSFLNEVRKETTLPVLQKDFVIDPFQIYEARVSGADAILLIASLMDREELRDFVDLARSLKLVPWVEIHDEKDLGKTSPLDLPLVGINNRDLKTFEVDLRTTIRLKKQIPSGTKVVSESGIKSGEDVRLLREAGVDGILVGETLMRSPNPASMIKELLET